VLSGKLAQIFVIAGMRSKIRGEIGELRKPSGERYDSGCNHYAVSLYLFSVGQRQLKTIRIRFDLSNISFIQVGQNFSLKPAPVLYESIKGKGVWYRAVVGRSKRPQL
jgi:hypothetical protein